MRRTNRTFRICTIGLFCVFAFISAAGSSGSRAVLFPAIVPAVQAQTNIVLEPVLAGLDTPVFVTNAGDGSNRLFIVEQPGRIKVLQPGATSATLFLDITTRVSTGGERGLLGLAFHPFYKNNRRFFVYYTGLPDGQLVVAEYRASAANPNIADMAETMILSVPHPTFSNHNGGTIEFGPDGYLYVGTGDGGSGNDPGNNAQNINQLLGKMLRIDIDHPAGAVQYSSPPDNPFIGGIPGRDEIYAVGLRNPYRFSFDRTTGQLFVGDVGQFSWEEIDIITRGGNYGWRVFEGVHCTANDPHLCGSTTPCNSNGFTCPIAEYSSASPSTRCSITGGYAYRGVRSTLPSGAYVYGDFCTGEILMLNPPTAAGSQSLLLDTTLNISSFGEDEAGEIYVLGIGGTLSRIANSSAPCSTSIFPVDESFPAIGGTGVIQVVAPTTCGWTATTTGGFITITSSTSGAGYGTVSFRVDPNASNSARNGTINISGQVFSISQGADFDDVSTSHLFSSVIGKLSARGITLGCNPQDFCPEATVTREQMAAFILRALGEFNPPTPPSQRFQDVPPSNPFYNFIDRLAVLGITLGCSSNPPLFCPDSNVTREEMAVFLVRALGVFQPFTPLRQRFSDVPPSRFGYAFIEELFRRGITQGCGGTLYCPGDAVTRGQMAAFIVRAFDL
jgi:glucose/arabinose dehydrogenase